MRLLRAIFEHPSGRIGAAIIVVYLVLALLAAAGIAVGSGANFDDADRSSGKLPAAEHAR